METMTTIMNTGFYLTIKQLATQQGCSERHIKDEMREMKEFIGERYAAEDFIEDEKKINQYAFWDYQKYRKALKDPAARPHVPEFDRQAWAEVCPVVERWRI